MKRMWLAALFIAATASSSVAQTVRGVVVADDRPISGVVVTLVDANAKEVGRALTDERGEYRLVAPAPGSYRLRTLRIGFQSLLTAPITLVAGDDITRRLPVSTVAFPLDTIRSVGRNPCSVVARDSTSLVAAIWDQARGALIATQLSFSSNVIHTTSITYQRMLDARSQRVGRQMVDVRAGFATQPWRSLSADTLRKAGYVFTTRDSARIYNSPDLSVLLSDSFLEDHCFRIVGASDERRLGIEFEPTPARRDTPEIRGTLWLDRRTNELLSMEHRYVNRIRPDEERIAGAAMGFTRMRNGMWTISSWSIHMPVPVAVPVYSSSFSVTRYDTRIDSIKVTGGELVLATTTGTRRDTIWMRPPMPLRGTVLDSASAKPLPRAIVSLAGMIDTTDDAGAFSVSGVLPGRYELKVTTPLVDMIDAVHQQRIVFADSTIPLTIRVPTTRVVASAQNTGTITDSTAIRMLEPSVTSANPDPRLEEFERHRKRGLGHFLTREDIAKRGGGSTASLLQTLPSLRIASPQGADWPYNSTQRCNSVDAIDSKASSASATCTMFYKPTKDEIMRGVTSRCYSKVYIDLQLRNPGTPTPPFDLREITPAEIEAIEYYAIPAEIPVKYAQMNTSCGLIIIHTTRGK